MAKGILVNYHWCSGCHVCEIACQMLYGFAPGEYGIRVEQVGPERNADGTWTFDYVPQLTDRCTLCARRLAEGKPPTCVQHCQANCLQLVDAEDDERLAAEHPKVAFLRPA